MMKKNRRFFNYQLPITNYQLTKTGFSFMELMVVVAIIGILILSSMPVFRQFTRSRNLKEGANMVASALRKTRGSAITYRKNYRMVLDTANHAIGIDVDTDYDITTNGLAENWQRLPEFVEFDSATWTITNSYAPLYPLIFYLEFESDGGLGAGIGAATENIPIIETSTGETKIIDVGGLTGRIRIE